MPKYSEEAQKVRDFIFENLVPLDVAAEACDLTPRTIQRYIAVDGLPVIRKGKRGSPFLNLAVLRDHILKQAEHAPPRRGRPPGKVTASVSHK